MTRSDLLKEFFESLIPFQRLVRTQKERFFKDLEISPTHLELLYFLKHSEKSTVKDVASRLNITSSGATQVIEEAVQHEHIERTTDEIDRRVVHLTITPKGAAFAKELGKKHMHQMEECFAEVTDEEIIALTALYTKIIPHLRKNLAHIND